MTTFLQTLCLLIALEGLSAVVLVGVMRRDERLWKQQDEENNYEHHT